jgi:Zn-dependent protease with chaperone function
MAVLLMIGFYTLALFIVVLLLFSIVAQIYAGQVFIKFALLALIGAGAIIIGVFPRPDRFSPPWPRLYPKAQPRLFQNLRAIAANAEQEMPAEVYLLPESNAWVMNRGGFMGFGSRRVMGIGLPLMYFLNVSELTAVLAHEFGHYYGGDTRLGPWIYKTRGAIGRTLSNLSGSASFVSGPFNAYGRMFLRVTHGISRQQEYTADAFAASIAGASSLKSALARLHGYGEVFAMYWRGLVEPTLTTGFLPQIEQGLLLAFDSDVGKRTADTLLDEALKVEEDEYDTHPPLRDRIAALESLPVTMQENSEPALSLLEHVDGLWVDLLRSFNPEAFAKLQAIDWKDVGVKVYLDPWRLLCSLNRKSLDGLTAGQLPAYFGRAGKLGPELFDHYGRHTDGGEQILLILQVAVAGVAVALLEANWTFVADPARGSLFEREGKSTNPDRFVHALATGQLSPAQWLEFCDVLGIRDVPLGGSVTVTT